MQRYHGSFTNQKFVICTIIRIIPPLTLETTISTIRTISLIPRRSPLVSSLGPIAKALVDQVELTRSRRSGGSAHFWNSLTLRIRTGASTRTGHKHDSERLTLLVFPTYQIIPFPCSGSCPNPHVDIWLWGSGISSLSSDPADHVLSCVA